MPFHNPQISPPSILDPGSCQAVRIVAILDKPLHRVEVTPEWLAQNARKRLAAERKRATSSRRTAASLNSLVNRL